MRVTVCQIHPASNELDDQWTALAEHLATADSDFLLLPEMAFSPWLAADPSPDAALWDESVQRHEQRLARLIELGVATILGTRPIVTDTGSRRNQAYVWSTTTQQPVSVREKYYLPDEEGYWEATWYERGTRDFPTATAGNATLGVQICTEMWFLEWARQYAKAGVELLCIPRATPASSTRRWIAGGQTAAVCAGAYSLSSNLWNPDRTGADCGGVGWIIDPEGDILALTSEDSPFVTVDVDLGLARAAKATYPRYVRE